VKKKLFIVNDYGCGDAFKQVFNTTRDLDKADALMFTGGEDISPTLYGEKHGKYTGGTSSRRDSEEVYYFKEARDRNLPIIGICRGAQLLCAMAGGKLVQHIKHPGRHMIHTDDGKKFLMNSLHHQMMMPLNTKHRLIAWTEHLSPFHLDGDGNELNPFPDGREPEVVYFEDIKGLGIQGHPEWMEPEMAQVALPYFNNLVKELWFK
jgi:putative glutamine amidotransferase